MPDFKIPQVGDKIYIDTYLFVTHGIDDFIGGICTISKVEFNDYFKKDDAHHYSIEVEEDLGAFYSYHGLLEMQEALKTSFGNNKGHKRPDYRDEFNMD